MEQMVSKKIAVSLMSLVIIVGLAFVAPPAPGAEFNVTLDLSSDIGAADGLQLPYPANDTLEVILYFDHAVVLQTTHLTISGYDENNVYDPAVVLAATYPIWPITADTGFRVSIAVATDTSKVRLQVAGGIPSADPLNADTSQALTADIDILAADVVGGPRVYGIQRSDGSTAPLTSGAINVIITLSEAPQTFTAAHINVTHATAAAPVPHGATTQNTVGASVVATYLTSTGALGTRPPLRTVDQLRSVIEDYMDNTVTVPGAFIEAVRELRTAVDDTGSSTPINYSYYYLNADGLRYNKPLKNGNYNTFPLVNDAIAMPTTQGTTDLTTATPVALTIPAASFDRSAEAPTAPNPGDYDTVAKYNFALARYNALSGTPADNQRAAYKKEKTAYDKYITLQKALQAHDLKKQQEWDQDLATAAAGQQVVPQNSLPPTGRDGMLHPYSVTITPTYTNTPVIVKVNRWPNTDASPVYYEPPTLATAYVEGTDKLTLPVSVAEAAVAAVPKQAEEIALPAGVGFVFAGAPHAFSPLEIEQLQEQIDLLIATGDRSPTAMRTLAYLQQLLATARPEKTQLLANFPNPFNPETWIPYELATDTEVKITIYTSNGVVVRILTLGHQTAGYYTDRERAAYWDGRNALGEQVASGIYFYQLETDEMSSLRKMVILK